MLPNALGKSMLLEFEFVYRRFFLLYGGIHILGGLVIAAWPGSMSFILADPPGKGACNLLAFLSVFAGLGFTGVAAIEQRLQRIHFVRLAIAANVLNMLAHFWNVAQGYSPSYLVVPVSGLALFIAVLLIIHQQLVSSRA